MMMLESCYKPLERCFGVGSSDGLLWNMDLKPHMSGGQYSIAVVQANSCLEDQAQVFTSPSATFVGVYDGHGGPEASRFITNHLFLYLQKFAAECGGLSQDVIKRAFDATETDFLHLVKESWLDRPHIVSVGSCCLLGVISNGTLFVANVGDSRAVLGRQVSGGRTVSSSTVVAERLSTDHNVGDEEIRKEVKALHPDDSHIVVHTRGVWRLKGIIQTDKESMLDEASEYLKQLQLKVQVGAIAPQALDPLLQSIHDCLSSSDWTTRKAAADTLNAMALHSSNLIIQKPTATITILEASRFDKIKPVRDSITEALLLWKFIAEGHEDQKTSSPHQDSEPAKLSRTILTRVIPITQKLSKKIPTKSDDKQIETPRKDDQNSDQSVSEKIIGTKKRLQL